MQQLGFVESLSGAVGTPKDLSDICSEERQNDARDWECFCFYGDQFNPAKPHCADKFKDPPPCTKERIQDPNDPECVCYMGDQFNYFKPYCKEAYKQEMEEIYMEQAKIFELQMED